jgi:hypothetical protein
MSYTSAPLELPPLGDDPYYRADLTFYGIDHSGPSFEGRVFLNNPDADASTPTEEASGYAGSFYIFGHGGCFGDEGHCEVPAGPASPFDRRRPHALTPATRTVIATDTVKRLVEAGETTATVTVVPVVRPSALASAEDAAEVLHLQQVALLTYDL